MRGGSADRPGDRTRHPRSAGRGPDRRRRGSFTSASLSEAPCRPRSSRRSSGGLPGWTARRSMLIEGPSSSGRPVPEERVRCDSGQLRSGRARVVTIRPRLWKGQDGGFKVLPGHDAEAGGRWPQAYGGRHPDRGAEATARSAHRDDDSGGVGGSAAPATRRAAQECRGRGSGLC